MARIQTVQMIDDLDGGEADETVTFAVDGKSYEIDLAEKRATELRDILAPFIAAARRAGVSTVPPRRSTPTTVNRDQVKAIRDWAKREGMEIAGRGRIPATIREAFDLAHVA
jgi:hypothetical protein